MKKRHVFFLVFILLLILPIAIAQLPEDKGFFEEGFNILMEGLSHDSVAVGIFLVLLFLLLLGVISSSFKLAPIFGGTNELDKNGKLAAFALTGMMVLGTFFIRKNAIQYLKDMAEGMSFFFALIVSLMIYIAVRWMFKQQKYNVEPAGNKIENIVSWVAGWGTLAFFGLAWKDQGIQAVAWTFLTIGTFLYMLGGNYYSRRPGVRADRDIDRLDEGTTGAIEEAGRAATAAQQAGEAGEAAAAGLSEADKRLQEIEEARARAGTQEGRRDLMGAIDEEIKAGGEVGKQEREAIKKIENSITSLKHLKTQISSKIVGLHDILSTAPEEKKKDVETLLTETKQFDAKLDEDIKRIETRKDEIKKDIEDNLKLIDDKEKEIGSVSKDLEKAKPEEVAVIQSNLRKLEKDKIEIFEANAKLLSQLKDLSKEIEQFSRAAKAMVERTVPETKQVEEIATEEARKKAKLDPAKLYEASIKAKGRFSGATLTNLAKLDREGFFEGKENLYHRAIEALKDKKVKYMKGAEEKWAFIDDIYPKMPLGYIPLYERTEAGRKRARFGLNLKKENRLEFIE